MLVSKGVKGQCCFLRMEFIQCVLHIRSAIIYTLFGIKLFNLKAIGVKFLTIRMSASASVFSDCASASYPYLPSSSYLFSCSFSVYVSFHSLSSTSSSEEGGFECVSEGGWEEC